jgi:hypothetical protein
MRRASYDFFLNYHKHSKEIVKIMKSGFGEESGVLGRCNDRNDVVTIQRLQEPEIEGIGFTRSHLPNGYPKYWKLKEDAVSDSSKILSQIEQIMDSFETKVVNVMGQRMTKSQSTPVKKG